MKSTSDVLIESFPYIQKFRDKIIVIKLGGSVLHESESKLQVAKDICFLREVGVSVVVVHGGGKDVTQALKDSGKATNFVSGYRYTAKEDVDLIEMILSGRLCKEIVSNIQQAGGDAVGLSGKDASLLRIEKLTGLNGEDLGEVGRVIGVNISLLSVLMKSRFIPVISSIGSFYDGQTANINADEVASAIASELSAFKLIYLSDVDGLMIDGELVKEADLKEAQEFLLNKDVKEGMIPKLEFTIDAIKRGVSDVHFINGSVPHSLLVELYTDEGLGTKFSYSRPKRD